MSIEFLIKEFGDFIKSNYKVLTQRQLREKIGCSNTQLCRAEEILGIKEQISKLSWNRIVNEDLPFSNSREWFYFVGLILADGWITEKNLVSIRVSEKDSKLIDDLAKWLNFRGTINAVITKPDRLVSSVRLMRQISFTSRIFVERLKYYGISCNKSGKEEYRNIPDEFFVDFLRGFMDGDGNISHGCIRLYSTSYKALDEFKKDLKRLYNVDAIWLKTNNVSYKLGINSRYVHFVLKDLMYKDGCLCLERKRNLIFEHSPKRNKKFLYEYFKDN